jgi:quercetin 2,3-dioxygenase
MINVRKSHQRGVTDWGWLDSRHTFSFGEYYDPEHVQFRSLRVINDDKVKAGQGFGKHGHRDMEILTYVLEGAIQHGDSMGNGSIIRQGDVQKMTAGTGVMHSEQNASKTEPVHFLQIWIQPAERGLKPEYAQKFVGEEEKRGQLRAIATPDGRDETILLHQDAVLYSSVLGAGEQVKHALAPGRHAWVQVARGSVRLNGEVLTAGDGAAITGESELLLQGVEETEVLLFDLA